MLTELDIVFDLAKEATDAGLAAVEETESVKRALAETQTYLQEHCVTKAASSRVNATAEAVKEAGLEISITDLGTHEGALKALEKLASQHKTALSELFDDPHGSPVFRGPVSSTGSSGGGAWSAAIAEEKRG
jgi:hypothetical protein